MTKNIEKSLFFFLGVAALVLAGTDPAFAQAAGDECGGETLGSMICNAINNTSRAPGLMTGFAYMAGAIAGLLGIIKLKEHVEAPSQVPIWDPIKRFAAGGAFFAMPVVVDAVRRTIEGPQGGLYAPGSGFNADGVAGVGLDTMIVNLVANTLEPVSWAVGWVGWLAGLVFVFIGISRLLLTEQQGARGPTGIGTIMTFLIAGALFSLNSMVTFINTSIFGNPQIQTFGTLAYADNLGAAEGHVHAVIAAIIGFSIIVGWISLARGLFIMRGVSEGNSQASMMAAITHLIGGVLAINLGSVIMAVQNTLGIDQYGIIFE